MLGGPAQRGLGIDFDFGAAFDAGGEMFTDGGFDFDAGAFAEGIINEINVEEVIGDVTDLASQQIYNAPNAPTVGPGAPPPPRNGNVTWATAPPPPPGPPEAERLEAQRVQDYWDELARQKSEQERIAYWGALYEQQQAMARTPKVLSASKMNWTPYFIAAGLLAAAFVLR